MDAMSERDRGARRLRLLALFFLLLGGLGFVAYHASWPYTRTVTVSELSREPDGFLVGDFEAPWPLKMQKTALDEVAVELADGTRLKRHLTRRALGLPETGPGFLVERPQIVFRLPDGTENAEDAVLSVTVPVKGRDVVYQVPLWIAVALFLLSWLRPIGAVLRGRQPGRLALVSGVVAALAGLFGLFAASGPAVWLALLGLLGGPLVAVAVVLRADAEATGRQGAWELPLKIALVLLTVFGSCALAEAYLGWRLDRAVPTARADTASEHWFQLPDEVVRLAHARSDFLTLPDEWRLREETVEGATKAYVWHGALHVFDQWGFRRLNGPFPPKDPATFRILTVGDSLTYGEGVAEEWTYSRLLERALQQDYRVDVINLGVRGYQSEDVLDVLYRFLPQVDPNLVIYAVCLNDFLPSGQRVYNTYTFPFPKDWKEYLLERTRLAQLLNDGYRQLLITLDLRRDFYDDILAGGDTYQARFARDVKAMNRLVRKAGLPPPIGIVFHQFPSGEPRVWDLIEIAERSLDDAGFELISVMSWRERFKDQIFPVDRWEGHPNELAHSLIAEELYNRLLQHGELQAYRKASASPTPGS